MTSENFYFSKHKFDHLLMSYVLRTKGNVSFPDMELPFKTKFNFKKVIHFWEELSENEDAGLGVLAKPILSKLNESPFLKEPFEDVNIIEEHAELLSKLFYPIFPDLTTNSDIRTIGMPFVPIWFNGTERFKRIVEEAGGPDKVELRLGGITKDEFYQFACVVILNVIYQARINYAQSMFFDIPNKKSGIKRHYRVHINTDFSEVKINKGFTPLTKEEVQQLIDNFDDLELWKEKFPPESYTYEGFTILKMFDVTREDAVSSLRYSLLSKDALQSQEVVEKIKTNIRSILNIGDVEIGFAAYDEEVCLLKSLGFGFWESISEEKMDIALEHAYCKNSHRVLFDEKRNLVVPRIDNKKEHENPLLRRLSQHGLQSYIGIPLVYNEVLIGVLEVGSKNLNELNAPVAKMLETLIPLFTTALKRSQDEMETLLEAIVQEKFTAIHPSVSWRFFEGANNYCQNQLLYDTYEMEEIEFPDVYPLYGQSDIKGSSTERNTAIQADMVEQLMAAKDVMSLAIDYQALPIYEKMKYRIEGCIDMMSKGLGAGDEIKVLEFMTSEVYPIFEHLKTVDTGLKKAVDAYSEQLDDELRIIYKKRKDYEYSVSSINENIAAYIETAQDDAQKMYPHYFEKYQTDGVEHDMYIGASMVKNKPFHEVYVQNMRLWQLMVTCEVENLAYHLKDELPVPLRVASLILIHSNSISIRFRREEKRFDVDGAYNVRYEIIKKRIDKALVRGTNERLTQVNKIAIVYSQEKEAKEYLGYLEYLQSINYIGPNIERLELKDMQGVTGMKALRVEVVYHEKKKQMAKSKAAVGVK